MSGRHKLIVHTPYYTVYENIGHAIGISLTASDALGDRRPPASRQPSDGSVDYWEVADPQITDLWKKRLGSILAKQIVKKDVQRQGDQWTGNSDTSVLLDFPNGYTLYIHKKGSRHDPRRDAYLYGSEYVSYFRSPSEFAEHAMWLMTGSPIDPESKEPDCGCVYCDPGRKQGEISYELGTRNAPPREKKERARAADDEGPPAKRPKRAEPLSIPAKDYTKLNTNT